MDKKDKKDKMDKKDNKDNKDRTRRTTRRVRRRGFTYIWSCWCLAVRACALCLVPCFPTGHHS